MADAPPWLFERLVTSCALYRNFLVLVAMLLHLRNSPKRVYVAQVALELLSTRLEVFLLRCLGFELLVTVLTVERPAGLRMLFTFHFTRELFLAPLACSWGGGDDAWPNRLTDYA